MLKLPPPKITIEQLSKFQPCAEAWRDYGVKKGCVTQLPLETAVEVEARTSEVFKVIITPPRDPAILSGELEDAGANLNNIWLVQTVFGSFLQSPIKMCVRALESLFGEPTKLTNRDLIVINFYPTGMGHDIWNSTMLTAMSQFAQKCGIAIIGVTE